MCASFLSKFLSVLQLAWAAHSAANEQSGSRHYWRVWASVAAVSDGVHMSMFGMPWGATSCLCDQPHLRQGRRYDQNPERKQDCVLAVGRRGRGLRKICSFWDLICRRLNYGRMDPKIHCLIRQRSGQTSARNKLPKNKSASTGLQATMNIHLLLLCISSA